MGEFGENLLKVFEQGRKNKELSVVSYKLCCLMKDSK